MKKWWINGVCMVLAGALTVFAIGCGDDDKGNNGDAVELTEEEQYAIVESVIAAAPGLMVQSFGSQFWDGVGQEDFEFEFSGLPKLVPPGVGKILPGYLARTVHLEADTVTFNYNNEDGWWVFHVEFSLEDDTAGVTVSLVLDDSVRFQTGVGSPQLEPNELTETFLHEGSIALTITFDADSFGVFGVVIEGDNDFTVTGLNDEVVTVNGQTDAEIDYSVDSDTVEADVEMAFLGVVDDVTAPNVPDACAEDGNIALDFSMAFDVTSGNQHAEAEGDWSVEVDFIGGGFADVDAHSGDFDYSQDNVYVCSPAPAE